MDKKSEFLQLSTYDIKSISIYALILFLPKLSIYLEAVNSLSPEIIWLLTWGISIILIIMKKYLTDYANENN